MPEARRDRDGYLLSWCPTGKCMWAVFGCWEAGWSACQPHGRHWGVRYRENLTFTPQWGCPRTVSSGKAPSTERNPIQTWRFQIIKVQAHPLGWLFQQAMIFAIKHWQLISGLWSSVSSRVSLLWLCYTLDQGTSIRILYTPLHGKTTAVLWAQQQIHTSRRPCSWDTAHLFSFPQITASADGLWQGGLDST